MRATVPNVRRPLVATSGKSVGHGFACLTTIRQAAPTCHAFRGTEPSKRCTLQYMLAVLLDAAVPSTAAFGSVVLSPAARAVANPAELVAPSGPYTVVTEERQLLYTPYQPSTPSSLPLQIAVLVFKPSQTGGVDAMQSSVRPQKPLAIFSSGFLVPSSSYTSYARMLASWGYPVVLYDVDPGQAPEPLDDVVCLNVLQHIIDLAEEEGLSSRQGGLWLCGHSRGAKLSVLAASADARVTMVTLLDPVDNTPDTPKDYRFPSALALLKERATTSTASEFPPVLIVGAQANNDCIPTGSNYQLFYDAWPSSCCQVVIAGAGHLSFLDSAPFLLQAVCRKGSANAEAVRQASKEMVLAWAEAVAVAHNTPQSSFSPACPRDVAMATPPTPGPCRSSDAIASFAEPAFATALKRFSLHGTISLR